MKTIRVVRNTVVLVLLLAGIAFAAAPKVVKTIPANGDQSVNPKLRQIKIVFDQPMSHKGYSVCGGGENFPNIIGKLDWFNATTLVMKVKLEPNHEYSYSVNCPSAGNFKNRSGESAEVYPVSFKTAAATDKSENKNGKAASVMLEEGLYAEQTEGNLDKAIGIYEQVLDKADETQEIGAKAAYQIGMCYLKKGDKDNAAQYFQIVTSKYADQKTIVEQANQQLEKVGIKPYTQEMHNEIDANGLIHFKIPSKYTNDGTEPMTSTGFINSDFVNVTGMYYKNGQPMKFTTTHEGNHFQYNITFDKPLLPGETIEGTTEGTMKGLIKFVAGMPDTYQYYMKHSPNTDVPTLRIETYLLPKGAEVISTSADMKRIEKDGRVELSVEKVIPAGGSLMTTFQYKLGGAKLAALEPLKLQPAPWVDGEVMELKLKRPSGQEYGTIIYSAQSSKSQGVNTWQIISHMYVTQGSKSQYTFVEAKAESFAPIYGQTANWMGNYVADYNKENVKLTVGTESKEATKEYPLSATAYDNEQAVYLIRRMPLAENYEGGFPIFTVQGATVVECRIKVLGVEDITVEAGTFKCYKTDLSIYAEGIKTLQHTLWFSDQNKYLVKYDVGGAATMELVKVWQRDKNKPLVFENSEPHFSVTTPADWRFYKYESPGPQFSLQLIPPEVKFWAVLVWQQRGTDPASESATTIAKANCEQLKGFFEKYTPDNNSWKELKISGLEAAQFLADYQDKGSGLKTYDKPKEMVEYRTYIVDQANVYWFVFRVEKEQFEANKAEFDSIVNSFVKSEKPSSIAKADKLAAENLVQSGWQLWKQRKLSEAEEKFNQAVKIDPGNDNAFQGLGWSQLNQGKKLNAKDSFEKCVKLNPKNSAALNGLGWIEHGQGNIDQAIQWWEKAVEASSGTATASLSGLTQIYMERKDYEKAVKYYQMWLKAEPDNQDAVEGLKKAKEAKGN
jgi:tetratricopeptide (TPR) repeat protein